MSAGQLRILKSRIKSVESTRKITRAMEMVSAAKLRRFQTLLNKTRPYTEGLGKIIANLVEAEQSGAPQTGQSAAHPFFENRKEKNTALLVITADTGLCGAYNMFLTDLARNFLARPTHHVPFLYGAGKVGVNALKRAKFELAQSLTDLRSNQIEPAIKEMSGSLAGHYLRGEVDAVYIIYTHVLSVMTAKPVIEKVLPFKPPAPPAGKKEADSAAKKKMLDNYIYEPSPQAIFEQIVPEFFEAKIRMIFLESFVAEHMARMNAMHQATKNAKEMTESLTLVRNKIRQTIITKEIIEIISGSKASKK